MPGKPSSLAQPDDRRRDHAEILGDERQRRRARLAPRGTARRRGRAASGRAAPSCAAAGIAQYATKPRKWSIRVMSTSSNVAAQALDPPAVARSLGARASRRADCPSAGRVADSVSGGAPATSPRAEELGVRDDARRCRQRRRSARRRRCARRARARSRAAPSTRARSEPGRRARPLPGERRPVARPERVPRDEVLDVLRGHARARLGEQRGRRRRTPTTALYGEPAVVGRAERQHLPPRLAGRREPVDEAVRLLAEPAARQRRRMQQDSTGAFESHHLRKSHARWPLRAEAPSARIQIRDVEPQVDCGRFPIKRVVGEEVVVYGDDLPRRATTCSAARSATERPGARRWRESPLEPLGNDQWRGSFTVDAPGRWTYTVAAWVDRIASWQDEVTRKVDGGQTDLAGELSEGRALLGADDVARGAPRGDERRTGTDEVELDVRLGVDVDVRARPLRRVVRAVPALVGRLRRRREASCRSSRSSASTSSTCRRSIRSGARTARAATTP